MSYRDELCYWLAQFTGSKSEPYLEEVDDLCDFLKTEPRMILKSLYADMGYGIQLGLVEWLCSNKSSMFGYCSDKLRITLGAATCNVRVINQYSCDKEVADRRKGLDKPELSGLIAKRYPVCIYVEDLYSFQPNAGNKLLLGINHLGFPVVCKVTLAFDTEGYEALKGDDRRIKRLLSYFNYAGFCEDTKLSSYSGNDIFMVHSKDHRLNKIPSFY